MSQCTGHKANGDPCGQRVRVGYTACYLHGSHNISSKLKAQQLLALARMPAIEALYKSMAVAEGIIDQFQKVTCVHCGYPMAGEDEKSYITRACLTVARIASAVLDRTGFGPHATVEVKQSDGDIELRSLTEEERAALARPLAELRAVKEQIRQRQLTDTPSTIM